VRLYPVVHTANLTSGLSLLFIFVVQYIPRHNKITIIHFSLLETCIEISISNSSSNNSDCSAPLRSDRWRIPEFTQCFRCKHHETENSSLRCSAINTFASHTLLFVPK